MIRNLILITTIGGAAAMLTLGLATWLNRPPAALDLDPAPLALALGLAASALALVAALLASFRAPRGRPIRRPRQAGIRT